MVNKWSVVFAVTLFLLVVPSVLADELVGYIEQPTTVSTVCIRNSQIMTNVNVTVRIYNEAGALIYGPVNSTPGGNGTFSTTYVFQNTGKYATKETCDFGDYLADGSTAINIIKPTFGNVQILSDIVKSVRLNRKASADWQILLPNSTGAANSTIVVEGGSCSVYDLNNTLLNVTPTTIVSVDRVSTSFVADASYGFAEDENYQILCDVNLTGGLMIRGVKNYLYVNPHLTFLQFLGQLLGIVEQTQATVNQTLSISNQTLQIVSNLNLTGGSGNSTLIILTYNNTEEALAILKDEQIYAIG